MRSMRSISAMFSASVFAITWWMSRPAASSSASTLATASSLRAAQSRARSPAAVKSTPIERRSFLSPSGAEVVISLAA